MRKTIQAVLRIPASGESHAEIVQVLRSLVEPTRVQRGCVSCRLYLELNDPYPLTWFEEWETHRDFVRHLKSTPYKKILAALDMADAEPEVRFDTIVATTGLETVEAARLSFA